ncbi:hypothetical protein Q1695_004831 [Nippostrongylus brasiliensis]|nr:hypothetical protein Q1695_004831 [Nippostrongylus brasiliensis]
MADDEDEGSKESQENYGKCLIILLQTTSAVEMADEDEDHLVEGKLWKIGACDLDLPFDGSAIDLFAHLSRPRMTSMEMSAMIDIKDIKESTAFSNGRRDDQRHHRKCQRFHGINVDWFPNDFDDV